METTDRLDVLDRRAPPASNLLLLGLWMRLAWVGAAFAVIGVASLIDPPEGVPFLTAVTWIVAGGTFAWLAWQRTTALIHRIDADEATSSERTDARPMHRVERASVSS
jgi:hypothetical protein